MDSIIDQIATDLPAYLAEKNYKIDTINESAISLSTNGTRRYGIVKYIINNEIIISYHIENDIYVLNSKAIIHRSYTNNKFIESALAYLDDYSMFAIMDDKQEPILIDESYEKCTQRLTKLYNICNNPNIVALYNSIINK